MEDTIIFENMIIRENGLYKYSELSEILKEEAREKHPSDYLEWEYKTRGVEIEFSAK